MSFSFFDTLFKKTQQEALHLFETLPDPDFRKEKLTPVDVDSFSVNKQQSARLEATLLEKHAGFHQPLICSLADIPDGLKPLLEETLQHLDLGVPADRLSAFHLAHVSNGMLVVVPKHTVVPAAVRIERKPSQMGSASCTLTLVIVEEGAELHLEEILGQDSMSDKMTEEQRGALESHSLHIFAKEGSRVHLSVLQNWPKYVYDLGYYQLIAGKEANLVTGFGFLGASGGRTVVFGETMGEGAEVRHYGAFSGKDRQKLQLLTKNLHHAPFSVGRMLYKGILGGQASSNLSSLIRIDEQARKTVSELDDATLLLSPGARSDSVPALDVHTNDIQCRHSASVKHTDKEQLFYLMSRGLDESTAQQLVIEGFFWDVYEKVPSEYVKARMRELMEAHSLQTA